MMLDTAIATAWQDGIDEAAKRIESFKNKMVLQMRLGGTLISDERYEFVCKLVDAQLKLLRMKGSASA